VVRIVLYDFIVNHYRLFFSTSIHATIRNPYLKKSLKIPKG